MGMGYAASRCEVVENDYVKECCPSYESLMKAVDLWNETNEENWWAISKFELIQETSELLKKVCLEFSEKHPGLSICPGYHSDDEGDRYDEIQGQFWELIGCYSVTPEAKAIDSKWKTVSFVVFG